MKDVADDYKDDIELYNKLLSGTYKLRIAKILVEDNGANTEEILLTNLIEDEFDINALKELYHLRWNIETQYNVLKNRLKLEEFSGYKNTLIRQDIFSTIWLSNLISLFIIEANLKHEIPADRYKYEMKRNTVTVRKILTDIVYIGHMENHKYQVENYKTKKLVRVPDSEHIIVKNTHEAIISEADFKTVQTVIKKRHYPAHHEHENLFKSILFCTCGKRMAIAHKVRKNKTDTFYKCSNHEKNPIECPNSNIIQYNVIKKIIHMDIMKLIDKVRQGDRFKNELVKVIKRDNSKSNSSEIKKTEARLNQLVKIASKLYEDYTADLINDRTYKDLLLKNKQEQDLLELKLNNLLDKEKVLNNKLNDLDKLISKFNEYLDNLELTPEMVNSLIERIELDYLKIIDGQKHRSMKIRYKFIDMPIDLE